jgi:hypothetical protein
LDGGGGLLQYEKFNTPTAAFHLLFSQLRQLQRDFSLVGKGSALRVSELFCDLQQHNRVQKVLEYAAHIRLHPQAHLRVSEQLAQHGILCDHCFLVF